MLRIKMIPGLLATIVLLCISAAQLAAQGVSSTENSGLDKYQGASRGDDFSFVGVRAAEFLTIPVGPRGVAMGSAYNAVADDISAIWWNPAGLTSVEKSTLFFQTVDYTMDLNYHYLAGITPLMDGQLIVGGFMGFLNIPQMEVTTINHPNGTGEFFDAYDLQVGGTVAYAMSDRFSAGANFKYVHQDVWDITASAFALDIGTLYSTELLNRSIRFAFTIQNLGTNMTMGGARLMVPIPAEGTGGQYDVPDHTYNENEDAKARKTRSVREGIRRTHTYRLPTNVKIGVSYIPYSSGNASWLISAELWRPSYIPTSYALGSELNLNLNTLYTASLRLGWQIQTDEYNNDLDANALTLHGDDPTMRGFSLGGGIHRMFGDKDIRFDYAYRNKGRLSADNFFSVTFGF